MLKQTIDFLLDLQYNTKENKQNMCYAFWHYKIIPTKQNYSMWMPKNGFSLEQLGWVKTENRNEKR